MPFTHTVKEGETLIGIAHKYHFANYKLILDDPDNKDFVKKRPNPGTIMAGDKIVIPDKVVKEVTVATGQKHTFIAKTAKAKLRVIMQDISGKPHANKPFKVEITDREIVIEDQTDKDGLLEVAVPADAKSALVSLQAYDDPEILEIWNVSLGGLNPVDEVSGIQQRLINLGIDCGEIDGINGPRTQAAIKYFQAYHELTIDGIVGEKTTAQLLKPPPVKPPEGKIAAEFSEYAFVASELKESTFKAIAIKLMDKSGNGIPDQPFLFKHSQRKRTSGKTDADGKAIINEISSQNGIISFDDLDLISLSGGDEYQPELDIPIDEENVTLITFQNNDVFSS